MNKLPRFTAVVALLFSAALVQNVAAQNVGTARVNGAPLINGGTVEGNVQQMTGASVILNGPSVVTGDLLVPGTPTLVKNGTPIFGGIIVGTGSASPSNYQVILNGSVRLGHLRTRTNPIAIPALPAVPTPTGTRNVTITASGQSVGNFATLRNLTLNGNVGQYTIPAGTYGDFTANAGGGFTLGVAGAQQPAVYNLQRLTLNGQTRIIVLGPVVINVANGFTANGAAGTSSNPTWLKLNIKTGGFIVNGGCTVYGYATVPSGRITINGAGKLIGGAACKDLTVNASGLLRLFDAQSFENHPPVAANQSVTTAQDTPKALVLSATDPDGQALTYSVVAQPLHGSLSGAAPQLVYTPAPGYYGTDSFTFKANDGQVDSNVATVSITVLRLNHAPVANPGSLTLNQNASGPVVLTGSDVDGDQLTFRVTSAPAHGALSGSPPNLVYTPTQSFYGTDSFAFVANDGALDSSPATVSITVNHPPVAQGQEVQTNENTALDILLTATDPDSGTLTYTVLAQPAHGALSGDPPNLTYTPAAGFFGSDSFTFRANDASASSETATVQITVIHVNRPPTANGQNVSLDEDGTVAILLTGNDLDGDPLTFAIAVQPQHGTLSGTPPNLVYTPAPNYFGDDSFAFRANDGAANSQDGVVNLTVRPVNDPPSVQISSPASGAEFDAGDTVPIAATASDPDGSIATFRLLFDGEVVSETLQTSTAAFDLLDVAAGDHSISAVVIDNDEASVASVQVPITVRSQGNGPVQVNAGPDRLISLPGAAHLEGSVTVNGAPAGANVQLAWQKISGPGTATFDNSAALNPTVNFDAPGNYVLKLVATAPEGTGFDTTKVSVLAAPTAGPDSPISNKGRDFWMAFLSGLPPPWEPDHAGAFLIISSEVATTGTVEIHETYGIPGNWTSYRRVVTFAVEAGQKTMVEVAGSFPLRYEGQYDLALPTAVHVLADAPVSVHALHSDDHTTDGSLILPNSLLGRDHLVMSYRNSPSFNSGGGIIGGTQVAVVATKDQTQITITPTASTAAHPAGQPFTVTLQQGEVYRMINKTDAEGDFTGTRVQSDKPVAVFGGHTCATVPESTPACDHLYEQMPPVDFWGRHFVTLPLRTRLGGDRFRMMAEQDGTRVSINGTIVATLNRGQFYETVLAEPSSILSDRRILLAQFAQSSAFDNTTGDPFLMVVPPYEMFGRRHILSTQAIHSYWYGGERDIFDSYVSVVVDTAHASEVNLNGVLLPAAEFVPIGDSGFSGATIAVAKDSLVDLSAPVPLGAWIYGWAEYESYGFTGGIYGAIDAASASLELTQSASSAPVGSTHRVRGSLRNSAGLPLPDAQVQFTITGANPGTGQGLTASDGTVEFSWIGTNAGTDLVTATSGVLSATLDVTWIAGGANQAPQVNAGTDQILRLGDPLPLQGLVQDDGLPAGGQLVLQWSVLPGPGDVTFADPASATTTATLVHPGQYRLRLTAYDGQFASDDELAVNVDIPPEFTSLEPSGSHVDQGKAWSVVVNARDLDGTIVSVELLEGAQVLARHEQDDHQVYYLTLSTVLTTLGQHSITVRLTDDLGATTDRVFEVTVRPAPTVQILTPANNTTFAAGESVTFTASASSAGGAITRVVYEEVSYYPWEVGDGTGSNYQFTWTPNYAGTYLIAATAYDSEGASGTSVPVTITVLSPGDPTIVITSPQEGSSVYRGQSATFQAEATTIAPATIESISFFDGYDHLGTRYSPPYEIQWYAGSLGAHTLRAEVWDSFGGNATTSITVNSIAVPELEVTLVQPQPNIPIKVNTPTTLAVSIENVIGELWAVDFYVNYQWIGDGSSTSVTWTPNAIGEYEVEVYAQSSNPNQEGSFYGTITVADLHSPVVEWTAPANNSSFAPNTPIVLQAQASDVDSNLANLQLLADGQLLSETPLSGGAGATSFTWENAGPGWHTLTALAVDDTLQTGAASLRVFVERPVANDLLPPSGLTSETTSATSIHLTWTPSVSANATATAIERRAGITGTWEEIATVESTIAIYEDNALEPEHYYSYRLAALDATGARSIYSAESSATTFVEKPTYAIIDITESLAQRGIAARFFDFKHLIASTAAAGTADPIELQGTRALSVNDNGEVLIDSGNGNYTVWRFQDQSYATLAKGAEPIVARAINAQGIVAGSSDHSYQDQDNNVHLEFRAQTWINGAVNEITPHDSLGDYHEPRGGPQRGLSNYEVFEAYGINEAGDVAGRGTVYYQNHDYSATHAALWSGNQWINLGGFEWVSDNRGRMLPSYATAVNGNHQVVGVGAIDSPQLPDYPPGTGPQHAFLSNDRNWDAPGRTFQDLGTLGGYESAAWDINANGFVIGVSTKQQNDSPWRVSGFVWEGSAPMQALPTLGGINSNYPEGYSYPIAINNRNQIAGQSLRADQGTAATLWQKNQNQGSPPSTQPRYEPADLNDSLGSNRDWFLVSARDISNSGLIVGQGIRYTRDGQGEIIGQQEKAYLLLPIKIQTITPHNNSAFARCEDVQLAVSISGFGKPFVSKVEYLANGVKVAEANNGETWITTWNKPTAGRYELVARALLSNGMVYVDARPIAVLGLPISRASMRAMLNYEVGGGESYYQRKLRRPTWPKGKSGVTIGIGYDLGYNSAEQIRRDWEHYLPPEQLDRLVVLSGVKRTAARDRVQSVRDIEIPWDVALQVFESTTLPRFIDETLTIYPDAAQLNPSSFGALVSLVFNRGTDLTGDRRTEMAEIASALENDREAAIPELIQDMKRLWENDPDSRGLLTRRDEEARLFQSGLDEGPNPCGN